MPKQVVPLSIAAPGFYGLNKQKEGAILEPGWATTASECVIDESGRITSRKGYTYVNSSSFTDVAHSIHEYTDLTGTSVTIFAAGTKIYRVSGATVVDITGTITTPTSDNWKFVNFNGACYGVQSNHPLIRLTTTSGTFANVTKSGTQQPTNNVNTIASAYGRLWALDGNDLLYSDLLDGTAWNGAFDLSKYWFAGLDEGTAIEDFNGFLVVFGKNNIIVFNNPYDPTSTMQIVENVGGIGCIARDSVQNIGTDLLFLSNTGVRSFGRTIQEKSMPVNDITKNVRDYLLSYASSENKNYIKSVYSPIDGFYLLSFPTNSKTFCIDVRGLLPDGSARVTEWDFAPNALARNKTSTVYFGVTGYIARYNGYRDGISSAGTGGSPYTMEWSSGWYDFGEEARTFLKIPKKITLLMGGMAGRSAAVTWGFDFEESFSSGAISFVGDVLAKYGIAQYTIDRYSGALDFDSGRTGLNNTGQVMRFGVSASVSGNKVILQRIDLIAKIGRVAI